jgi:hypothetical protein
MIHDPYKILFVYETIGHYMQINGLKDLCVCKRLEQDYLEGNQGINKGGTEVTFGWAIIEGDKSAQLTDEKKTDVGGLEKGQKENSRTKNGNERKGYRIK